MQCIHTLLIIIFIDIKDLDIVIKALTSDQYLPHSVWRRLGPQLGLYDKTLKNIKADYHGLSVKCFRQCMSAWLRGEDIVREKGGPSWSSLAAALDTIGEKSIASYIRDKYCDLSRLLGEHYIEVTINRHKLFDTLI